jgi:hypothetical protein
MAITNFHTLIYIARLNNSAFKRFLKIGISNDPTRRQREIKNVTMEYLSPYYSSRSYAMAIELLAQVYAYVKVGRPDNYLNLPVKSGSSEFFNTENEKQALGFIYAAIKQGKRLENDINAIIEYALGYLRQKIGEVPKTYDLAVKRLTETIDEEYGATA